MKGIVLRRLLCALAVLGGAVLLGLVGGTASWLLFWASLAVPLFSAVNALLLRRGFRASFRADEPRVLHGERLSCTLLLINGSPFPAPEIRIRMRSGKLDCGTEELVCALGPFERKELPFTPLCRHCGEASAGAESICVTDVFGLFALRLQALTTVQVLPRRRRIRSLSVAPLRETEQRFVRSGHHGERLPDGQLRNYVPGDDVRRIHWKVSALQGKPILRSEADAPRGEIVLLPDARAALPAGAAGWLAEDSITEGALCIADYYLRQGVALRVIPDEARAVTVFTPSDYERLYQRCSERFFSGAARPDELLERYVAANGPALGHILLTWELDEAFLRCVGRCIELGAEVSVICVGGPADAAQRAAALRRLTFDQVTAQRDVFAVLDGSGGEGGAS